MPLVDSARDLFVVAHRNYANGPIVESRGSAMVSGVTTTLDCGERQTIRTTAVEHSEEDMHVRRPLAIPTLLVAAAVFCVAARRSPSKARTSRFARHGTVGTARSKSATPPRSHRFYRHLPPDERLGSDLRCGGCCGGSRTAVRATSRHGLRSASDSYPCAC